MKTFVTLIVCIGLMTLKLSAQKVVLNTVKKSYHISELSKKGGRYYGYNKKHRLVIVIPSDLVLSFIDTSGNYTTINDSIVFSRLKKFNKSYTHLKPIQNLNFKSLIYNNRSVISERDFISILKNIDNTDIHLKLKGLKRNKCVRTSLLVTSGCLAIAGFGTLFTGLMNSSGRNSYPQDKRDQAAFQTNLGLFFLAASASFSISTIFINHKNHNIIRNDLVKRYNEEL